MVSQEVFQLGDFTTFRVNLWQQVVQMVMIGLLKLIMVMLVPYQAGIVIMA